MRGPVDVVYGEGARLAASVSLVLASAKIEPYRPKKPRGFCSDCGC
ncbi:hypothetical protein AB0I82_16450 [Streptomyces sp. NPDC050315]